MWRRLTGDRSGKANGCSLCFEVLSSLLMKLKCTGEMPVPYAASSSLL